MNKQQFLELYPVHYTREVTWGDMDSFQHVNNSQYFKYLESARVMTFEHLCDGPKTGLESLFPEGKTLMLAETRCRFKVSVTYPDTIYVGIRLEITSPDTCMHHYEIFSDKFGFVAAEGDARLVYIDLKTNKREPIPESFIEKMLTINPLARQK